MYTYREAETCGSLQRTVSSGVVSVQIFGCGRTQFGRFWRSHFYRHFTTDRGWTLPALFSILRDLRDLAFDVTNFDKISCYVSE